MHRLHSRRVKLEIWLLSLGLVLSTATQLRISGLPIGPGEILLSVWLLLMLTRLSARGRLAVGPAQRVFGLFWLGSFILLGLGWLVSLGIGEWEPGYTRDIFAFAFVAILVGLLLSQENFELKIRQGSIIVVAISVVAAGILLVMARLVHQLGPLQFWYGARFRGWAENPNQMGILMVLTPFLLIKQCFLAETVLRQIAFRFLVVVALWVGYHIRSDALFVAWIISFGIFVLLSWLKRWRSTRKTPLVVFLRWVVLPAMVGLLVICMGSEVYSITRSYLERMYFEGSQGSVRFALWRNGIAAISSSPIVGLGPGGHSGVIGALQGAEAHNTFIDWGASTGIVGILLLVGLFSWLGYRMLKARSIIGLATISALVVFSFFHYTLRHPIIWYYIIVLTVMSDCKDWI